MADDDAHPPNTFPYRGEGNVPRNEVRVEVHRSVTEIPDELFIGRDRLESVLLHEGLRRIGEYAFCGCSSLRRLLCPSTVTEIGEGAFARCSSLAAVAFSEGIDLFCVESMTFYECTSLVEVQIPLVHRIGSEAFWGCRNLASVRLRECLWEIGDCAFGDCSSLGSVSVPSSVGEIGQAAFHGCSGLSLVRLHEDLLTMSRDAFRGCPPESLQFVRLSERMEAMRMDDRTKSMFESRLRDIALAYDSDDGEEPGDFWKKCKESLGRAHEVLTCLELKGAAPVLELAQWKGRVEGEGDCYLSPQGRERKRPKVMNNIGQDARLSREDCGVKCGASIALPEVLKFFTYSSSWPRLDDSEEGNVD